MVEGSRRTWGRGQEEAGEEGRHLGRGQPDLGEVVGVTCTKSRRWRWAQEPDLSRRWNGKGNASWG